MPTAVGLNLHLTDLKIFSSKNNYTYSIYQLINGLINKMFSRHTPFEKVEILAFQVNFIPKRNNLIYMFLATYFR